jgi:hypothetical protein
MNQGLIFMLKSIFPTNITTDQAKDTGMAMTLILLLIGFFTKNVLFYQLAIPVLVLDMIYPMLFFPVAVLWLGLSHLMGTVMSKVLLSIVFVCLVIPIGIFRRMTGKDALQLKQFRRGSDSVMRERNHRYQAADLEKPY